MADNKRASMNNRVATPRMVSSQVPQALRDDASIARAIGAKVRITTTSNPPRTHEGHLFSAHTPSNILTITPIYPPSANTTPALTVLPISNIQNLTIVAYHQQQPPQQQQQPQSSSSEVPVPKQQQQQQQNSTPPPNAKLQSQPPPAPLPALPQLLDPAPQQARLRAAIARVQAEDARRGKGVTKEAQEIFDAISRTLPAQWDGENIIVLGQVLISKPYRVEDCKAGKDVQAQMVQRIKKVLENERKKLAEKSGAAGVRKGG